MDLRRVASVVMASCLALSCREGDGDVDTDTDTYADSDGAQSSDGSSETGASADDDVAGACRPTDTPPRLRRLTVAEYQASVRDLLGVDVSDLTDRFVVDASVDGFSNNASVQSLLLGHARAYQDVAEIVAERLLADAALRDDVVGCTPTGDADDPCMLAFAQSLAAAAYRRPPEPSLVDGLVALAASSTDPDPWTGVALVVRGALQSPRFVFRIERGNPDPDDPVRLRLDGYEIATRLSYALWQTTPDDWLRDLAADGTLETADGVAATAAQMLADPRARAAIEGFAVAWLRLSTIDDLGRNPQLFPEWSPSLRDAMRADVVELVADATLQEGNLAALWHGRDVWIDDALADVYGLPAPTGQGLVRTELPPDDDRGGLLGTAAVLAATTPNDVTSPVRRGLFVWETLLCTALPPPPPGVVGELPPPQQLPKQQALELHRADPSCAGCHDQLDPIGLGLEGYDALGRHRTLDEGGQPVVDQGVVPGADAVEFVGAGQLSARLSERDDAHRCFATQILRWSMGRSEIDADACLLDALGEVARAGDFFALVEALVTSEEFRTRPIDSE